MNLSHFPAMLLFALIISLAFAFLTKHTAKERLTYAAWAFLMFVLIAIAIGWVMYPFPR